MPTKMPYFKFKSIYAGSAHTLAIDFDDDIWVFGNNNYGQLGLGDTKDRLTPTKLHDLKAKSISTDYHTIVIDLTDSVWVFGLNDNGQLGLGDTEDRVMPIKLANLKFKFASAGLNHTVAVDFNNDVWVFGDNDHGQLGLGDTNARLIPTKIPSRAFGLPNFKVKSIVAGGYHTVALDFNDEVWTFGSNYSGQLGLNDRINRVTPTKISSEALGLTNFKIKSIFAGSFNTMAINFNNDVWVFGNNNNGQLGLFRSGYVLRPEKLPSRAFGLPNFKATHLAMGESHTVAISDYEF
jgi:alpha-tubulin suppressor-like RCC1 family protein